MRHRSILARALGKCASFRRPSGSRRLRQTVAEMAEVCASLSSVAPDGQFTAAQLRDRLENGRKVAIQILESGTRLLEGDHDPDTQRDMLHLCARLDGLAWQLEKTIRMARHTKRQPPGNPHRAMRGEDGLLPF